MTIRQRKYFLPLVSALFGAALMVSPVHAADDNPFSNATDDSGGGVTSQNASPRPVLKDQVLLGMTRADCERAIAKSQGTAVPAEYQPGVDVRGNKVAGADYQPGVDVRGNKVAEADLAGSNDLAKSLPKKIQFNLDIDVFDFSNRADLQNTFGNVTSSLGKVEYDLNTGVMKINGVPLNDPQADAIAIACMQALGRL